MDPFVCIRIDYIYIDFYQLYMDLYGFVWNSPRHGRHAAGRASAVYQGRPLSSAQAAPNAKTARILKSPAPTQLRR